MSLFDQLVDKAVSNQQDLAPLRVVVEKEILHHDILQVLSRAGLLEQLTFIGGTCLRACYGSNRLSEDLDFTGGADFTRDQLAAMSKLLIQGLNTKYGLEVIVTDPIREQGNVDTWKLKVQTRPKRRDLASQRINIDVCSIASYDPRPMALLNAYGIDLGTNGLILSAQSREEIFADKLIAFALRPNRLKNRDLWDMAWLHQRQVKPALELIHQKLKDHHADPVVYLKSFEERAGSMIKDANIPKEFRNEMRRFLPNNLIQETVSSDHFWDYLSGLMKDFNALLIQELNGKSQEPTFKL